MFKKEKYLLVITLLVTFLSIIIVNAQEAPIANSFRFPLEGDWSPLWQDFGKWNNQWNGYHLGEDIGREDADIKNYAVYPMADGVVKFADIVLGYTVIIEHKLPVSDPDGDYVCSVYYHMKRPGEGGIKLKFGEAVSTDSPIGYVSGKRKDYKSVPHLHFGIRKGPYKSGKDTRTGFWYYPGYTTIKINNEVQKNPDDPTHEQVLADWFNPSTDLKNGTGFIERHIAKIEQAVEISKTTPIITSPLKIIPDPPYHVGDTINAEFTITNQSSLPIKFSVLSVGGRDPDNHVSDFTHRQNITLEPFKPYKYQGTLILNKVGDYHFFCTYQTPDGNWNTNVDLGSGLADEDRIREIVVIAKKAEKEAVYVTDGNNHRIQKFTSEGRFTTKWGKKGNGDGEFDYPTGIAVDSQGNVYVTDGNNHRIQKFTSEGRFITKWGKRGSGDGEFDCPIGIAVDSQGNVYVADWGNHRIQKFTSEGRLITKWGKEGLGTGNFRDPVGIAVDSQGNVYVVDWNNHCIQKFTSEGRLITKWEWDKGGTDGGEFDFPTGIAIDSQGNVYVVNEGNHCIQKFTSEGRLIIKWGKEGSGDGEFDFPTGIAIDSQGNVYVTDENNCRIQKFTSEGRLITKWDKEGSGDGEFDCPTGIAISRIYETEELEEKEKEKPSIAPDISKELYIEWDKTFGGSEDDRAFSILQTADGGYTVAGWTNSKGAGKYDTWIIKLDQGGNMLWDKTFGGSEDDWAFSILQTADGGYTVAGWTNSKGAGKRDAWVIKLDQGGNMLWDKTFGGSEDDRAFSILQTADGGYILTGATESKGAGKRDIWVIKLDQGGNMLWDKTFGGSEYDRANVILQTADGGYAVAGWTNSKGAGEVDAWVIKLDQGGNMLWDKTFGGSEDDAVGPIIQTADGGYILTGETNSKGAGKYDIWVIKLDQGGNMLWDKTFGGSEDDTVGPIIQTADGGYILTGATESKGAGKRDAWVIKLDQGGNMLWDKTFGGSEDDAVGPIIQTADGGYIVAGWTISKGAGEMDTWVIKLSTKSIEEAFEEEVNAMEALEDKIEKEKLLIDSSLYHIECNKPIVSGNIFIVIPVNVSGPADELALILTNPKGETDIRFISKRALIDNFETVKLHMGNAPLSEGPYILTVKTVTPENVIYKKELWFTPPDVSIVDAEFTYKITHLGGAYGHAGYYFLEIVSLTLINNGDLPAKRDTNARALITLDGKPENMTLLTRPYSISPYETSLYPPIYIPNGKNKVRVSAGDAMYGLKKGQYFVTITIPLIGGETVIFKKALTIE